MNDTSILRCAFYDSTISVVFETSAHHLLIDALPFSWLVPKTNTTQTKTKNKKPASLLILHRLEFDVRAQVTDADWLVE